MPASNNKFSRYLILAVVGTVFLMHLILAKQWVDLHTINFFNNTHVFLNAVSQAYHEVVNAHAGVFDFSVFTKYTWTGVGAYWPTLAPMVSLWSLLILPAQWFFLINFCYLALIMWGLYSVTRLLIGDRWYSMLSAVIFSCYWLVTMQLVAYDVQLAATAGIVWSFYWYFRSRFFSKFIPSLLMGLMFVLALYCDHYNPALFILPLFLVPENFKEKRSWFYMAIVAGLVGLCAWPHYARMLYHLFSSREAILFTFSQGQERVHPIEAYRIVLSDPYFLFSHMSYYLLSFPERIIGIWFSLLFVVSACFLHRLKKPETRILWMLVLIPLIIATLIIKKNYIYIFPLTLTLSIMTAAGLYLIRTKWLRICGFIMICALCLWQYKAWDETADYAFFLKWYFTHQYEVMEQKSVPKMMFYTDGEAGNGSGAQTLAILHQTSPVWQRLLAGQNGQGLIIDLKRNEEQHAVAFYLASMFPQTPIFNVSFMGVNDVRASALKSLYLLTDKSESFSIYATGGIGGRKWRGISEVSQFNEHGLVLYQIEL